MPTTIPYQPPDTLFIIAAVAAVCVALLFGEASALRHIRRGASVPWLRRFIGILRGVGLWWLIVGASGLLIPLFFTVVLRYSSGDANGDLSILLVNIFHVAAGLALVTLGVTLVLLLVGGGAVIYLTVKARGMPEGSSAEVTPRA